MSLELKQTLLVTKESILNQEHNLWIGYSYGNKWFTQEHILELINFGLTYTKDSLLIWIPGRLYATNFRYIENNSRADALRQAFEVGDKHREEIEMMIQNLPEDRRNKIIVANYDETLSLKAIAQREILMREFSKQGKFYKYVMDISNAILKARERTVSKERAESVALYVLQELPFFLDGISKVDSTIVHTVMLYPGLGELDFLVENIKTKSEFGDLRERLKITHETGIADIISI